MEITEEKLKEILDKRFDKVDGRFDKHEDKFQRYVGVMVERFESQTKLIAESISGIQQQLIAIRDMVAKNTEDIEVIKVEIFSMRKDMLEMRKDILEMRKDILEMKKDIEIMQSDIGIIKQNLRRKVDLEDFEVLEKRVMFLEKKLATG